MRIGLTCYPTYGGSGAVATELALELGRRGHDVHIISYASPFRLRGLVQNVVFHEVDISGTYPLLEYFPYSLALAVKQHEVALREQLDILHVHYAIPHAPAAFLAKQMLEDDHDIKVVTTLHGTDITLVGLRSSFFTVTRFAIERSDAVTAVSEYLREATYQAFGCAGCRIEVIPNFVNPDEYFPVDQKPAGCAALAPPGQVDAVAELLHMGDLYLLPSRSESVGLSALEAMACGVPVIGSRVGVLVEVVVDGKTGALEQVEDLDAMAARAIEILADERTHRRMCEASVERA
ncbi:MAG: glycosyltransferase, partial [Gemmatimonadales bacterium]